MNRVQLIYFFELQDQIGAAWATRHRRGQYGRNYLRLLVRKARAARAASGCYPLAAKGGAA